VQGAPHDTLELQYGGEAKLYLPVENIDLLTRYGADSEGVQPRFWLLSRDSLRAAWAQREVP